MIVIKRRKKEKRKTKSFSTKNWYCISVSVPKIGIVSLFQYQILVLKLRNRHLPSLCRFLR